MKTSEIIPPAVTRQVVFEMTPEAFNQVELRRIGWKEVGLESVAKLTPLVPKRMAFVVAHVIENDHRRFISGQFLGQVIQKRLEGILAFAGGHLKEDAPRSIVHRAKHRAFPVFPRRRNPHRVALLPPDFRQVGVGMDLAFVHIDQMESVGVSNAFF